LADARGPFCSTAEGSRASRSFVGGLRPGRPRELDIAYPQQGRKALRTRPRVRAGLAGSPGPMNWSNVAPPIPRDPSPGVLCMIAARSRSGACALVLSALLGTAAAQSLQPFQQEALDRILATVDPSIRPM